ncbi:hypothetical protein [Aquimarina macrocephali]|uniref:hypothetical protein n=1 Tax=Aquimarina macrocephali TaxID=666563 RepID=UPI0004655A40|nr:hypothetical protein [Aquimarina macrocephali]
MLKIIIHSEFPNESPSSDEHLKKIAEFKDIVKQVLTDYSGEIEFDYISKYQQFETKKVNTEPEQITTAKIEKIERLMPNCWI